MNIIKKTKAGVKSIKSTVKGGNKKTKEQTQKQAQDQWRALLAQYLAEQQLLGNE